jgi:hypothetical protein
MVGAPSDSNQIRSGANPRSTSIRPPIAHRLDILLVL